MTERELSTIKGHITHRLADAKCHDLSSICLDMPVVERLLVLIAEVRRLRSVLNEIAVDPEFDVRDIEAVHRVLAKKRDLAWQALGRPESSEEAVGIHD